MNIYKLETIPGGQKSFGGKAIVYENDKIVYLESCHTIIAFYDKKGKKLYIKEWHSNTAQRHTNAFLYERGLAPMKKSEIIEETKYYDEDLFISLLKQH